MANSQPIRIAIIGGGLAGASLIHALLKYAHLDVHIFESAPAFRENGMAVGIARNALTALDVLGPSAAQSLSRAGAVPQQGVRFKLGEGTDQGSLIAEADAEAEDRRLTSIVQRAAFLRELLANIPPDRMHASKKLASVDGCDDKNGPITLHFTDGSTHECDILVGADGIHSTVRKLILGEQDPASQPRNTGFWVIMILSPYEKAHNVLEKAFMDADDPHEYVWLGNDQMIMHNVLENGSLAQFVVGSIDPDAKGKSDLWQRKVSSEELTKFFDQGTPGLNKAVKELLCDQTEQTAFYLWEHLPARTYASGPVCIIGDAAHATTPWQGSGAGMSIEDCLILSTLLGRSETVTQAKKALDVYDRVRRPRTQRIVESSRGTGMILLGKGDEGLDLAWLKQNLLPRWDFILDFDNEKHRDDAVRMFQQESPVA